MNTKLTCYSGDGNPSGGIVRGYTEGASHDDLVNATYFNDVCALPGSKNCTLKKGDAAMEEKPLFAGHVDWHSCSCNKPDLAGGQQVACGHQAWGPDWANLFTDGTALHFKPNGKLDADMYGTDTGGKCAPICALGIDSTWHNPNKPANIGCDDLGNVTTDCECPKTWDAVKGTQEYKDFFKSTDAMKALKYEDLTISDGGCTIGDDGLLLDDESCSLFCTRSKYLDDEVTYPNRENLSSRYYCKNGNITFLGSQYGENGSVSWGETVEEWARDAVDEKRRKPDGSYLNLPNSCRRSACPATWEEVVTRTRVFQSIFDVTSSPIDDLAAYIDAKVQMQGCKVSSDGKTLMNEKQDPTCAYSCTGVDSGSKDIRYIADYYKCEEGETGKDFSISFHGLFAENDDNNHESMWLSGTSKLHPGWGPRDEPHACQCHPSACGKDTPAENCSCAPKPEHGSEQ